MGLRPTHGDESALLRFIDSKQGYSRLSRECNGDVTTTIRLAQFSGKKTPPQNELETGA